MELLLFNILVIGFEQEFYLILNVKNVIFAEIYYSFGFLVKGGCSVDLR